MAISTPHRPAPAQATAEPHPTDRHALVGRHPGDIVRVVLGVAGLAVGLLVVQRQHVTNFERDVFRLVNDLPSSIRGVLVAVMQMGNLFAGPLVAILAVLVVRRWRPGLDLVIAGPLAWVAARVIKDLVQRPRPGGLIEDVLRYGPSEGLGFVSGHTAVATALVTAAAAYLPRTWRRAAWVLPWVVGLARIYEGAHLPLDIVGGAAVGWAIGAGVHLALGAPRRVPTIGDARRVLHRAGWSAAHISPVTGSPRGSFPFVATVVGEGSVFVKLLDPEPRDRDLIFRIARLLAIRDIRDEAAIPDAAARADHEVAMALLARSHGARVPVTRRIEHVGSRRWLVQDHVNGTPLDGVDAAEVSDAVLKDLWRQVAALHSSHMAHRDLVGSNVLIDSDQRAWLVDFAHAQSGARARSMDNDVAELLVSTALIVGPRRAVEASASILGTPALRSALPELQPLALTAENRLNVRSRPTIVSELRAEVARIAGIDVADAEPARSLVRVVAAVLLGFATAAVLVVIASPSLVADELATPGYRWLGVALFASILLAFCTGATHAASLDRRLALGRTALARLVASPIVGHGAANRTLARHLERVGVPAAAQGFRRVAWARFTTSAVGLVAAALVASHHWAGASMPDHALALGVLGAAGLALPIARAGGLRRVRSAATPPPEPLSPHMRAVLVLSALGETLLGAACAVAAVTAFGGAPAIAVVVCVHLAATAVAAGSPAGGAGLSEVVMVAGLSAAGMAFAPAVLGALAARIVLFWLPFAIGRAVAPTLRHRLVI